jgi:hypothetical protein
VVDDHQVSFARQMAAVGWVRPAETEQQLHKELAAALASPAKLRRPWEAPTHDATALLTARLQDLDGYHAVYPRRLPAAVRAMASTLRGVRV